MGRKASMAETAIIPASNVEGNVTSCKIERQTLKVEKNSAFSLQQKTTYLDQ